MDDVKRYQETDYEMFECDDGEYVTYADYAALQSRLAACEKERDEWRAAAEKHGTALVDLRAEVVNLISTGSRDLATAKQHAAEDSCERDEIIMRCNVILNEAKVLVQERDTALERVRVLEGVIERYKTAVGDIIRTEEAALAGGEPST